MRNSCSERWIWHWHSITRWQPFSRSGATSGSLSRERNDLSLDVDLFWLLCVYRSCAPSVCRRIRMGTASYLLSLSAHGYQVYLINCRATLRSLDDRSVDSLITLLLPVSCQVFILSRFSIFCILNFDSYE